MRQWTVDAFASQPFRGNQACILEPFDAWLDAGWMQAVAAENNQAETAYLLRDPADPARFGLRWFTPALEVPLCGHATLAAAHVLFTELALATPRVTFDTLSGPLIVERSGEGYAMDFPATPATPSDEHAAVAEAIGVEPVEVWAGPYLVAIVADEGTVRAVKPDMAAVLRAGASAGRDRGNMIVAALADAGSDYDVVSRFFAPGSGIDEDPATGSAHCILSPLYAAKLGRNALRFFQAYPGRGAEIGAELRGDRVILSGRAVTVVESRLRL